MTLGAVTFKKSIAGCNSSGITSASGGCDRRSGGCGSRSAGGHAFLAHARGRANSLGEGITKGSNGQEQSEKKAGKGTKSDAIHSTI
ncbi:hypothetical protein GCM10011378_34900 [Hymenobacter glacieicola]|uniref:Uncharacterized protein n=1 Tax=Hymenobacter glacieicola TaxID=1562124 RepID=A0ABQ1X1T6_9BACT|nr:hypothetical protein GCM10011378_34900 [Hymenobacter glacieicola]